MLTSNVYLGLFLFLAQHGCFPLKEGRTLSGIALAGRKGKEEKTYVQSIREGFQHWNKREAGLIFALA
jgi:hypothetical protein